MNKHLTTLLLVFLMSASLRAQSVQNIIIITTDGFRWQEVFEGMDAAIASQRKFNQGDSDGIYKKHNNY